MVALNFQRQFAPKILSGAKTQTVRATARATVGDMLPLSTGQRTPNCVLLMETECVGLTQGVIDRKRVTLYRQNDNGRTIILEGENMESFARLDGFENSNEMILFFESRKRKFPFHGWLYGWIPNVPVTQTKGDSC